RQCPAAGAPEQGVEPVGRAQAVVQVGQRTPVRLADVVVQAGQELVDAVDLPQPAQAALQALGGAVGIAVGGPVAVPLQQPFAQRGFGELAGHCQDRGAACQRVVGPAQL